MAGEGSVSETVRERAARVRLAIFDVDGVLSDGRITYTDDGRELKAFHVQDGFGLKRLMANDIMVAIITARNSRIVTQRMSDLGIDHIYQGQRDKRATFESLIKAHEIQGVIALESHIEKPEESAIFTAYPKIMKDHFAVHFICDTLRMMTMNLEDPHQVEDAMEKQLEKHHHEAMGPANALQNMADALPALGIVAAVLGIIKTMGAIDQPPVVLGAKIGSALVGTFLGVFLAYGLVGPFAARLKGIYEEEAIFYHIIQNVLVAHLHGNAAQISVEIGRGNVPSAFQPSFIELEEALSAAPAE